MGPINNKKKGTPVKPARENKLLRKRLNFTPKSLKKKNPPNTPKKKAKAKRSGKEPIEKISAFIIKSNISIFVGGQIKYISCETNFCAKKFIPQENNCGIFEKYFRVCLFITCKSIKYNVT